MILRPRPTQLRYSFNGRAIRIRSLTGREDPNLNDSTVKSTGGSSVTPQQKSKHSEGNAGDLQSNLQRNLRSWTTRASHTFRGHADNFSSKAAATFSQLGGKLNAVTGYEEIEKLKKDVVNQEAQMVEARRAAKEAKEEYDEAQARRNASRQEVNDLLQRKSSWSESDVNRFTQLVRQDHLYEQDESRTKLVAARAADAVEAQFSELMRSILARYHEEQVWSDKIRSASTYGSLAVLGLNLAVFILAIIVVEPWKRRRLVESFERRVVEMNTANQNIVEEGMSDLKNLHADHLVLLKRIEESLASSKDDVPAQLPVRDGLPVDEEPSPSSTHRNWHLHFDNVAKAAKDRPLIIASAGAVGVVVGWALSSLVGR